MPDNCIFCNIVGGKIPSLKVYEDSKHVAFLDINPRNPGHTVVVTKAHVGTLMEMSEEDAGSLFKTARKVALAVKTAVAAHGISISQSNGIAAGQRVPHVHVHVIPRFETESPPGLEEIIPTKRLDQNTLKAVGDKVKTGFTLDTDIEKSVEKVFKDAKRPEDMPKRKGSEIDFKF
ncbi:MAG: HIT family protein [Candidatus Aenigmatarchaeota archaeon]